MEEFGVDTTKLDYFSSWPCCSSEVFLLDLILKGRTCDVWRMAIRVLRTTTDRSSFEHKVCGGASHALAGSGALRTLRYGVAKAATQNCRDAQLQRCSETTNSIWCVGQGEHRQPRAGGPAGAP